MHSGRRLKPALRQLGPLLIFILSSSTVGIVWITYQATSSTPAPAEPPASSIVEDEDAATMRFRLLPNRTKDLIATINEAARLAGGGAEPAALTSEERDRWDAENPCKSRFGLQSMYSPRGSGAAINFTTEDAGWDLVLEEYSKLHRICRQRVGNSKEYFVAGNTSIAGCKFSIADFSEGGGLGNKIIAVANTVLYSILTQRVVLVPTGTMVPALMCEPFPGSSWVLDPKADETFPLKRWQDDSVEQWALHNDVYNDLDATKVKSGGERGAPPSKIYAAAMLTDQYQPESRFFCDAEQASFAGVTWLHFSGCLYTIPRFFAIPSFRATLEALFPDRLVITRVVRSVMLPDDVVWERLLRSDAAHMKDAARRVGVQIRYTRNAEQYEQMNQVVNERILQCAVQKGVLPKAVEYNETGKDVDISGVRSSSVVKILVASLFDGFSDMMSQTYLSRPTASGEVVGMVQLSHNKEQSYGLDSDRQALVEILMLSFSDSLFVTPLSTFGGLAQAYGALMPWIIDFRIGKHFGPCERAQTVDLCYHEADFTYACPHDQDIDGQVITEVVPYISDCLAIDSALYVKPGFQLITELGA